MPFASTLEKTTTRSTTSVEFLMKISLSSISARRRTMMP